MSFADGGSADGGSAECGFAAAFAIRHLPTAISAAADSAA